MNIKSILIEKEVSRHAYLIVNGENSILIDPGAKHHCETLIREIKKEMDISNIRYIVLQSNDYLNITSLDYLIAEGFQGDVLCNETFFHYVEDIINYKVKCICDMDYQLILEDLSFEFITSPFLPYQEAFMTYEANSKTLFSSHLFSQEKEPKSDTLINSINKFHEHVLPSVDFVREAIKKISKYNISKIYPRLGESFENEQIDNVVLHSLNYDFYNTAQVVIKSDELGITYNYEMICNHMLRKLSSMYHRDEILTVFENSQIHLKLTPSVEIETTELSGYKLWNYFFNCIYEKKGIMWLAVLESTVRKYGQLYKLNKPDIYNSEAYLQQSKITELSETTTELTEKVKELESEITETTDKMLRDSVTNLYNERFMIEYLNREFSKEPYENSAHILSLFRIDNIFDINKKYGTQQGDDTLRSLAYILNNMISDSGMLFKQNGPGIFLYLPNQQVTEIIETMLKFRNAAEESDAFIEPITVSLSIVLSSEIDIRYEVNSRVSTLMSLALKRMELAKTLGTSQIIDGSTSDKDYVEGIVLLVDEDETYQNMMVKIFERINYKVIITSDIYKAYEKLSNEPIDMIISEINLSKLDGFQFKHMINQAKDYKDIPFIIVSHHKDLDVVMRANLLDIDLILQKPIIPEELLGHINRMRQRKKSS